MIPVSTSTSVRLVEVTFSSEGERWTLPVSGGGNAADCELGAFVLRASRGETKTGGVGGAVPCSADSSRAANGIGRGLSEGAVAKAVVALVAEGNGGSAACGEERDL